ncbi:hypothetical protein [Pseudoalteromonas sp. Of11M-6]|uniref:hypothetical protein n=1 Tax=Pseudoalteromonas sp. Of11M-6 TaxID=2917754 RepID=UPI001EF72219|nr:hypothetical protein [Pseudoalteromonas sp. Of11M-6]MCG7556275.1 hypothetical protein [Pseudoalteromonas sp. Of11M-6]
MNNQNLIDVLSSIQFKQSLDLTTYIVVGVCAGFGGWLASYFKEKGKNYANKEDFIELKSQLSQNTSLVEGIKTKLSNKSWISQQVWVKKQEAYEVVFELLFHVKCYVSHQLSEYEKWEYINHQHPYMSHYNHDDGTLLEQWNKEKAEYKEKANDPTTREEAEKLKIKYEEALSSLFQIIEVKSIYLDTKVEDTIKNLKSELSKTDEHEEWDDHFYRISRETSSAIEQIRKISKSELNIET